MGGPIGLFKSKAGVPVVSPTVYIGARFVVSNFVHVHQPIVNQQSHTFLRFVGRYFFGRQSLSPIGSLSIWINPPLSSTSSDKQFTVGRTVVVNGNNRVVILLHTNARLHYRHVLHFCIGTLNSIEFDSRWVSTCFNRGNWTATQTDCDSCHHP